MKKYMILTSALLSLSFNVFAAGVIGGSSDETKIKAQKSTFLPFGAGEPGIAMLPTGENPMTINLQKGPIKHIKAKFGTNWLTGKQYESTSATDSRELWASDVVPIVGIIGDILLGDPIAEVWYNQSTKTEVVTARQIAKPAIPGAPDFGAVTIVKVKGLSGVKVNFGEWSPKVNGVTNVSGKSTNLNMNSADRTVWYVGDNKTTNIATSSVYNKHAKYDVSVVQKSAPASALTTGNFYAYFGDQGRLYGKVLQADLGTFNTTGITTKNAKIDLVNGSIERKDVNNVVDFQGQFYGADAAAIAGIYEPATATDRFAFGGKQVGTPSTTPFAK